MSTMVSSPFYLFLDFDGVMHPYACLIRDYLCRRPMLEAFLREHPQVMVVISSSWRDTSNLEELRAHFSEDLRHRFIDVTPSLPKDTLYRREEECRLWMRSHANPWDQWVAVDDDNRGFKPFCPLLIQCDPEDGLTQEIMAQVTLHLTESNPTARIKRLG